MEAKIKSIYNKLKMKPPEWIPEIDKEIFKVGKQEGIREVVEELRKREVYAYAASPSGVHLVNLEMLEDWQAKLKDWGL